MTNSIIIKIPLVSFVTCMLFSFIPDILPNRQIPSIAFAPCRAHCRLPDSNRSKWPTGIDHNWAHDKDSCGPPDCTAYVAPPCLCRVSLCLTLIPYSHQSRWHSKASHERVYDLCPQAPTRSRRRQPELANGRDFKAPLGRMEGH